jgi:hypothetical protein
MIYRRAAKFFVITLILLASACSAFSQAASVDKSLCYAYLRDGELQTSCEGKHETIGIGNKLSQFAISADGAYAAFESENTQGNDLPPKYELTVVDLQNRSLKYTKTVNATFLMSTCGELVGFDAIKNERRNLLTWDTDELFPYDPLNFVCSSDRHVVAGLIASEETESLYDRAKSAPVHVHRLTSDTRLPSGEGSFDMSPNGKYVVSCTGMGGKLRVCIRGDKGSVSCIHEQRVGRFSLSDSADVLYIQGTPFEHAETLRFWRPGISSPVVLSKPGEIQSSQWITLQVAQRLREWAAKIPSTAKPQ